MQKIGYAFPGQRSACYSADLLLRQYKRVKGEMGKKFSYKDIKKVYTIVFFEKSTSEFHHFKNIYLHHMKQQSDTGLRLELLQEYVFIALDIFQETLDNKSVTITNELEAWLTFLSIDDPDTILKLIQSYPKFEPIYRDIYEMCLNLERMIEMFSKELAELDKNTVQYMIDEMQDKIDAQANTIEEQKNTIQSMQETHEKELLSLQEAQKKNLLSLQEAQEKEILYLQQIEQLKKELKKE